MTGEKRDSQENSVGVVETQYFTFDGLKLESGEKLSPVTLAYETYGSLNEKSSNAVLILHALSGDAHAAGVHEGQNNPGWWDGMVGPGKAFDTNKYYVICSNVLGGCKGSTGPSSVNPKTGRPYALDFPLITMLITINVYGKCPKVPDRLFRHRKIVDGSRRLDGRDAGIIMVS